MKRSCFTDSYFIATGSNCRHKKTTRRWFYDTAYWFDYSDVSQGVEVRLKLSPHLYLFLIPEAVLLTRLVLEVSYP